MSSPNNPFEAPQSGLPAGGMIEPDWDAHSPASLPSPAQPFAPSVEGPREPSSTWTGEQGFSLPAGGVVDGSTMNQPITAAESTPTAVQAETAEAPAARKPIFNFARELIDANGKPNFRQRLKRSVGQNLLSLEDRKFRRNFNIMMGGNVLTLAGMTLIENTGTVGQALGATMTGAGLMAMSHSTTNISERWNELFDDGTLRPRSSE